MERQVGSRGGGCQGNERNKTSLSVVTDQSVLMSVVEEITMCDVRNDTQSLEYVKTRICSNGPQLKW